MAAAWPRWLPLAVVAASLATVLGVWRTATELGRRSDQAAGTPAWAVQWLPELLLLAGLALSVGLGAMVWGLQRARAATREARRANELLRLEMERRSALEAERRGTHEALERLNAELSRSNGELEQFAYVASHDLQEPLRKIRAFGERLSERHGSALDETGRDYMARLLDATTRMQQLIDDLLAYSRIQTRPRVVTEVELEGLIRCVLEDLERALAESGGRVEMADLPGVEADPTQLRALFQNLISNAIKFRHPARPPLVRIEAVPRTDADPPGFRRIRVADNGMGFDPQYGERIFALFERLHGRAEFPGTGLGLAICRRIVERHGGRIWADAAPDVGATFTMLLPVRAAA